MHGDANETTIVYKRKEGYKMIRQYMMGELLGEGQQGKVKEAIDSTSLRRVAIKIVNLRQLRKVCNGDSNTEESVRRELSIHRKLKHPNVVELIEQFVIEEKQKLYAVLELVPGGNLQDVATEWPNGVLPLRVASFLMRQLFCGLEYCHSKGVVHRDVKPSNLMVSTDGQLKITDFGVAEELQRYQDGDLTSKSRGSPAFQPPEVAVGSQSFSGFKVDVWAAGVSLFLLTTGEVPFTGSSLIHLFDVIAKGEYHIPALLEAQPDLLDLIQGLMRPDHSERLSVSEALKHPWLAEQERAQVWGATERESVQRTIDGSRSTAMLRAIAKMYGEKFEGDDQPECAMVASHPFVNSVYAASYPDVLPSSDGIFGACPGPHANISQSKGPIVSEGGACCASCSEASGNYQCDGKLRDLKAATTSELGSCATPMDESCNDELHQDRGSGHGECSLF